MSTPSQPTTVVAVAVGTSVEQPSGEVFDAQGRELNLPNQAAPPPTSLRVDGVVSRQCRDCGRAYEPNPSISRGSREFFRCESCNRRYDQGGLDFPCLCSVS